MEFTNEILEKMKKKLEFNEQVGDWFYKMYVDSEFSKSSNKFLNISKRVKDCLTCWDWKVYSKINLRDVYKNKYDGLMDLQKVNRCKNRFCSNCRTLDLARAINNIKKVYKEEVFINGAYTYILTLTVPNCRLGELRETILKIQNCYKKFWKLFSTDSIKYMYKERYMQFTGGIRCVEVTYNKDTNMFHPHFHILITSNDYPFYEFQKKYCGEWSYKKELYNMYSDIDFQIRKIWTCLYYNKRLSEVNNLDDLLICDIREMDSSGVYEVLKYVFKDTDIKNFNVFENMYNGIYGLRIRQGYGVFYNCKMENDSEGQKQNLFDYLEEIKELPKSLLTPNLEELIKQHSNYIKISRFNKHKDLDKLE